METTLRPLSLVTGASSGIGRALAMELCARGHDVVVVAEDAGIEAVDLLGSRPPLRALRADLADPSQVERVADTVAELSGPLEVLALNVGVGISERFIDRPVDEHLRLIDLNVRSTVHLAGLLLPAMAARRAGRVLLTSSIAATTPGPYQSTYNASKAFVQLFAQALRAELAETGVTVTAALPGPTDTEFFARAGLEDTKLAQVDRDDPASVAAEAIEALYADKDQVITGAGKNKLQATVSKVLPERLGAAAHARMAEPGSGT